MPYWASLSRISEWTWAHGDIRRTSQYLLSLNPAYPTGYRFRLRQVHAALGQLHEDQRMHLGDRHPVIHMLKLDVEPGFR